LHLFCPHMRFLSEIQRDCRVKHTAPSQGSLGSSLCVVWSGLGLRGVCLCTKAKACSARSKTNKILPRPEGGFRTLPVNHRPLGRNLIGASWRGGPFADLSLWVRCVLACIIALPTWQSRTSYSYWRKFSPESAHGPVGQMTGDARRQG
jgi:hypothetical protein